MSGNLGLVVLGTIIGSFTILAVFFILAIKQSQNNRWMHSNKINKNELKILRKLRYWSKKNKFVFVGPSLYKNNSEIFKIDAIIIANKFAIFIKQLSIPGEVKGDSKNSIFYTKVEETNYEFDNPILYNDEAIKKIQNIFIKNIPLISLIIFSNDAENINIENCPSHTVITTQEKLFMTLKEIELQLETYNLISNDIIETIYYNLKNCSTKRKKDFNKFITKQI